MAPVIRISDVPEALIRHQSSVVVDPEDLKHIPPTDSPIPEKLQVLKFMVEKVLCGHPYDRRDLEPWVPRFTCFSKLPAELRVRIWKYALPGPRIVELRCKGEFMTEKDFPLASRAASLLHYVSDAPIPVGLHVCRESRIEALKIYKLSLGYGETDGKIFVDFSRDTILIGEEIRLLFASVWYGGFPDMEKIKHLICVDPEPHIRRGVAAELLAKLLMKLPDIEDLYLASRPVARELDDSSEFTSRKLVDQESIDPRLPGKSTIGFLESSTRSSKTLTFIKYILARKYVGEGFVYPISPRVRLSRPLTSRIFAERPHKEAHMKVLSTDFEGNRGIELAKLDDTSMWGNPSNIAAINEEISRRRRLISKVKVVRLIKKTPERVAWKDMSEENREEWRLLQVILNSVQYKVQEQGVHWKNLTQWEQEEWSAVLAEGGSF